MSDTKLVSPLLDGFAMGEPMGEHDGVRCCPAMRENSDEKYIVKIISVPASQRQLDALLLTGAYKDSAAAADYFKEMADGVVAEAQLLQKLSRLEGFLPYSGCQVVPMEGEDLGYNIYLLGTYKRSLEKFLRRNPMTHLGAVNLGLDLCAALAICRRSGHMYVDLKPSNIYLTGDREYRIGDLGFVKMNALKYTSLPGKYRSTYTPPELQDDLATLNPTVDIYGVGMVLYQIYNNGQLPTLEQRTEKNIPAPLNADYEMAEIILKAIAPNPRNRYQTPIEMGQALVSYMQRNTVNDVPIVPPAAQLPTEEPEAPAEADAAVQEVPVLDETLPDENPEEIEEAVPVTEEVTTMFGQADDLLADPVPSMEDVAEPEPEETPEKDEEDEDWEALIRGTAKLEPEEDDIDPEEFFAVEQPKKKSAKGFVAVLVLLLLLALLGGGGYYYYQNYYLLPIENMVISGHEDAITVVVTTDVDTAKLEVVCTDSYGNTVSAPIVNGQASFTGLNPDTQYKITVEAKEGFHKVSKSYYGSYSTEKQTSVLDFTAKTGLEDGSVVLSFAVDGPESQDWIVEYSTQGEEPQQLSFTGHTVTISELTVGKMYTFTLLPPPGADQWIAGTTTLDFAAARMVVAENVIIVSCENGVLTAQWNAPADITVNNWTVRCYSDAGYDQTLAVTEPTAQFEGVTTDAAYTVEVWAEGMTQSARAYLTANPTSLTGITAAPAAGDPTAVNVAWTFEGTAPANGWLLMYTVDGRENSQVLACADTSAVIQGVVPGSAYALTVQNADGSTVFNNKTTYEAAAAASFSGFNIKADNITANMCRTPEKADWTYKDVDKEDYTTGFGSGTKASLILSSSKSPYYPEDATNVLIAIRNESGQIMSELTRSETKAWSSLWNKRYCTMDITAMPEYTGSYTLEVYFNGALAATRPFSITE